MRKKSRVIVAAVCAFMVLLGCLPTGIVLASAVTDAGNNIVLGNVLYQNDFEGETVGSIASDWNMRVPTWGWNGSGSTQKAEVVNLNGYGKVMEFTTTSSSVWMTMPKIPTRNYVFETTVVVNTTGTSRLGIANCMFGNLQDTDDGSNEAKVYFNTTQNHAYTSSGNGSYNKFADAPFTLPNGRVLRNGDVATFKLESFKGVNTLYLDGEFVASHDQSVSSADEDYAGFYCGSSSFYITEVKVTEILFENVPTTVDTVDLVLDNSADPTPSLRFNMTLPKTSKLYTKYVSGSYEPAGSALQLGAAVYVGDAAKEDVTVNTTGAEDILFDTCTQDDEAVYLTYERVTASADRDAKITVRPYAIVNNTRYYGQAVVACPALVATNLYMQMNNTTAKLRLNKAFVGSAAFGGGGDTISFAAYSDFHYFDGAVANGIQDLEAVFDGANAADVSFVLSLGDMTQDAKGSPELYDAFLKNAYGLPAYNIYGNHELESADNSMEIVTPTLTNDPNVLWGTNDTKMDTSIGYYYFERGGFRFVCIDTNYYQDTAGNWLHNPTASWGSPSGALNGNSLGPVQLAWLEQVLMDAAAKDIPCIVAGHVPMDNVYSSNLHDQPMVKEIFRKANAAQPNTVIMYINGHEHNDLVQVEEGIVYKYVNVVRGCAGGGDVQPRPYQGMTFPHRVYDSEGNLLRTEDMLYTSLNRSESYYSTDPMYSVITVNSNGTVYCDGVESTWLNGEVPPNISTKYPGTGPVHGTYAYNATNTVLTGALYDAYWQADAENHWHTADDVLDAAAAKTDVTGHTMSGTACTTCGYDSAATVTESAPDKELLPDQRPGEIMVKDFTADSYTKGNKLQTDRASDGSADGSTGWHGAWMHVENNAAVLSYVTGGSENRTQAGFRVLADTAGVYNLGGAVENKLAANAAYRLEFDYQATAVTAGKSYPLEVVVGDLKWCGTNTSVIDTNEYYGNYVTANPTMKYTVDTVTATHATPEHADIIIRTGDEPVNLNILLASPAGASVAERAGTAVTIDNIKLTRDYSAPAPIPGVTGTWEVKDFSRVEYTQGNNQQNGQQIVRPSNGTGNDGWHGAWMHVENNAAILSYVPGGNVNRTLAGFRVLADTAPGSLGGEGDSKLAPYSTYVLTFDYQATAVKSGMSYPLEVVAGDLEWTNYAGPGVIDTNAYYYNYVAANPTMKYAVETITATHSQPQKAEVVIKTGEAPVNLNIVLVTPEGASIDARAGTAVTVDNIKLVAGDVSEHEVKTFSRVEYTQGNNAQNGQQVVRPSNGAGNDGWHGAWMHVENESAILSYVTGGNANRTLAGFRVLADTTANDSFGGTVDSKLAANTKYRVEFDYQATAVKSGMSYPLEVVLGDLEWTNVAGTSILDTDKYYYNHVANNPDMKYAIETVSATHAKTQHADIVVETGDEEVHLNIVLVTPNGASIDARAGTAVTIDNIKLTKNYNGTGGDSTTPDEPAVSENPTVTTTNFEDVAVGNWGYFKNESAEHNFTVEVVEGVSHTGNKSVKITQKAWDNGSVRAYLPITDYAVAPGEQYLVNFWVYTADTHDNLGLRYWIAPNNGIVFASGAPKDKVKIAEGDVRDEELNQWTRVTVLGRAVPDESGAANKLVIGISDSANANTSSHLYTSTFYVDDITVTRITDEGALQQAAINGNVAVYNNEGSFEYEAGKAAMRYVAGYKSTDADRGNILLNGADYDLAERGLLFGTTAMSLNKDGVQGTDFAKWVYKTEDFNTMWRVDADNTVGYSLYVTGVNANNHATKYAFRSYVSITVDVPTADCKSTTVSKLVIYGDRMEMNYDEMFAAAAPGQTNPFG